MIIIKYMSFKNLWMNAILTQNRVSAILSLLPTIFLLFSKTNSTLNLDFEPTARYFKKIFYPRYQKEKLWTSYAMSLKGSYIGTTTFTSTLKDCHQFIVLPMPESIIKKNEEIALLEGPFEELVFVTGMKTSSLMMHHNKPGMSSSTTRTVKKLSAFYTFYTTFMIILMVKWRILMNLSMVIQNLN